MVFNLNTIHKDMVFLSNAADISSKLYRVLFILCSNGIGAEIFCPSIRSFTTRHSLDLSTLIFDILNVYNTLFRNFCWYSKVKRRVQSTSTSTIDDRHDYKSWSAAFAFAPPFFPSPPPSFFFSHQRGSHLEISYALISIKTLYSYV